MSQTRTSAPRGEKQLFSAQEAPAESHPSASDGESGSFVWAVLLTTEDKQTIHKQYGLADPPLGAAAETYESQRVWDDGDAEAGAAGGAAIGVGGEDRLRLASPKEVFSPGM